MPYVPDFPGLSRIWTSVPDFVPDTKLSRKIKKIDKKIGKISQIISTLIRSILVASCQYTTSCHNCPGLDCGQHRSRLTGHARVRQLNKHD